MSDLVERLRQMGSGGWSHLPQAATAREAADEIDRLRAAGVGYSQQTVDAITRERDALRGRLRELLPMDCPECGPMVMIDEDVCCVTCGRDATYSGAKEG